MQRRSWVFKPSLLLLIVAALVVYGFVAEAIDFHLITLRSPGKSVLHHRLMECLTLWLVVCSVVGWTFYFLKRRPERNSIVWPIFAIPLIAALWLAASKGFDVYRHHVESVTRSIPPTSFWLDIGIPIVGAVVPLFYWAAISVILIVQVKAWRCPVTVGICPTCEYDLTGNESGVCPECGSGVLMDSEIPHYFYGRRFVWMPEFADFPDAKARFDASQQATKEFRRSAVGWLSNLLTIITFTFVAVASLSPRASEYLGKWHWVVISVLLFATVATTILGSRYMMRNSLRRQLASRRRDGAA
ncbi:MAG TPA: hypothetical protein PKN33_19090 [Phycisphaerae bacterium]|nr:hypothetical protein [Phycisphaerae bacterium]